VSPAGTGRSTASNVIAMATTASESPDGPFVVGPVADAPGLWIASGCNGSGFSSSPAIGAALASWIFGDEPAGLAALAPGRFPALTDEMLIEKGQLAVRPLRPGGL
jgi:glycine/D-amino acid oxidase-like deaminating enzyme